MQSRFIEKILVAVFVVLLSQAAFAQTDQARIVGIVTDVNNAVVPGASVAVKNDKTGEARTVIANGQGEYIVTALKPSFYTITISKQGFAAAESKNVQLSVGQELNLNVTLQPEGTTVVVNVVSESEPPVKWSHKSCGRLRRAAATISCSD